VRGGGVEEEGRFGGLAGAGPIVSVSASGSGALVASHVSRQTNVVPESPSRSARPEHPRPNDKNNESTTSGSWKTD
jgi:hypothetical protein